MEIVERVLRVPTLRRRLWRWWYQRLVRMDSRPDWTFMNYGYCAGEPLELSKEREADRYCIQLYDLLASATALEGREVLEVGSGRGGGAAWVHERHRPALMTGVDYTPANIELCRARHTAPGLDFEAGDAEALPFENDRFDAVLNLESSHCYGSRARFFGEVARVLQPGGCFLYADLFSEAETGEIRRLLAEAGLRIESEQDIGPGVFEAMRRDDERKRRLIEERAPRWLHGLLGQFAGVDGSGVHNSLGNGAIRYLFFVLRKAG